MASMTCFLFVVIVLFLSPFVSSSSKKAYLVHMRDYQKPEAYATATDWYIDHFTSTTSSNTDSIMYTYEAVFNGYAAMLSPEEADSLRNSVDVLRLSEDHPYQIDTTRTPMFLGLENDFGTWGGEDVAQLHLASESVIIGVIDTGIWPESKSFSDVGLSSVPSLWRGQCEQAPDFNPQTACNKKLIGARVFYQGYEASTGTTVPHSPRDLDGHGTHTASTAAGAYVSGVSLFGLANGTARGMATHARIAAYHVCFPEGCYASDILAAMEAGISDGVDIMSLSVGVGATDYYDDPIAIGGFKAMQNGILVVASVGNSGPIEETVENIPPWITTIGASTIDKTFPSYVKLGNGVQYTGVSLYRGLGMGNRLVGLVYNNGENSSLCLEGSLDTLVVFEKVVICDRGGNSRVEKGEVVQKAGGVGMIIANPSGYGDDVEAYFFLIPALNVGEREGDAIKIYTTSMNPTAVLSFGGTVVNVKSSPIVAEFSSRGPNSVTPQILKPDLIAPGVNILAAWTGATGPSGLPSDNRMTAYNIISGTSMACPHVSGVSALLKAIHPDWSPSAIRSALMTTAYNMDNTNSVIQDAATYSGATPYELGAGHIQPEAAVNPGLVYNITINDYNAFICSLGYSDDEVYAVKGQNQSCLIINKFSDPGQLNYPSFSVVFNQSQELSYIRTLTNVEAGLGVSIYRIQISVPSFVTVTVIPSILEFSYTRQQ